MQALDAPVATSQYHANAISADGTVATGYCSPQPGIGNEACRWTPSLEHLGGFPGGNGSADSFDISADGSVIVGIGEAATGGEAYRWTQATGMVDLGNMPGGGYDSANGISADGLVIVGHGNGSLGQEAFRWTQETGMVGLGDLPGGYFSSTALAVSEDGSVIVGHSKTNNDGMEGFIWDASNGMRHLQQLLVSAGNDLTGWSNLHPWGISDDGRTVVGLGTFLLETGRTQGEAWVATVPEPTTAVLFVSGAILLVGFAGGRRGQR